MAGNGFDRVSAENEHRRENGQLRAGFQDTAPSFGEDSAVLGVKNGLN